VGDYPPDLQVDDRSSYLPCSDASFIHKGVLGDPA